MNAPTLSTAALIEDPPAIAERIKHLEDELKIARRLLRLSIAARLQHQPNNQKRTVREVLHASR
jgi:hypothetical protein